MEIKSHFKHNVFIVDDAEDIFEHIGGVEDYLLAAKLYEETIRRWPKLRIQMRQETRIVYDSRKDRG